jgi:ATP-dependent helicase Lhr and Lhr-like helicase
VLPELLLARRKSGPLKAIVFVPSRSRCDSLAAALSKVLSRTSPVKVVAHHGSLSKPEREAAERLLNDSHESVAVATSTLEIGIDIGDISSVVLEGPPGSVSSLLQRVGRANRRGGATHVLPLAGNDVEAAILASMLRSALRGELDPSESPRHYSVAIQQIASILKQTPRGRISRPQLAAWLGAEFGNQPANDVIDALIGGDLLETRPDRSIAAAEGVREIMDAPFRLHGNIGGSGSLVPVVDDVTGDPIAWVPRQEIDDALTIAGRHFTAEATDDAIRVRERDPGTSAGALRYAARRAPISRSALRHLAIGVGLPPSALVRRGTDWLHFGGALFGTALSLLGGDSGALSSKDDPRRVSVAAIRPTAEKHWQKLEKFFGFGPFQRMLPADLRQRAVADSFPYRPFDDWIAGFQEVSTTADQNRVLSQA